MSSASPPPPASPSSPPWGAETGRENSLWAFTSVFVPQSQRDRRRLAPFSGSSPKPPATNLGESERKLSDTSGVFTATGVEGGDPNKQLQMISGRISRQSGVRLPALIVSKIQLSHWAFRDKASSSGETQLFGNSFKSTGGEGRGASLPHHPDP